MKPEDAQVEATLRATAGSETPVEFVPAAPVRKVNTSLYQNSRLCGSAIERHYEETPDALFNDKKPNFAVIHEAPEHRVVVFLKAQGLSNVEISKRIGYTTCWVSQVLRQPWARLRLIEELRIAGRDAVKSLITASAEDSVYTLIEVRDDPKSKPSDRVNAARELLDRAFGKPTQHVEQTISTVSTPDTVAKLDAEIAALEAETKRLTGN